MTSPPGHMLETETLVLAIGHSARDTFRYVHELGIETLFVSNAAGGMNPEFQIGDLMVITDHINFFPEHPLRGKNFPTGPRFPDMHEAYDHKLINKAKEIAKEKNIKIRSGVYVGFISFVSRSISLNSPNSFISISI